MNQILRAKNLTKLMLCCLVLFLTGCAQKKTVSKLFNKIPSAQSNIHFNNVIVENDSLNPIDMEFLYNGGGIAVGDFNRDGLADLYFTASTTSNKLYLNKGNLVFQDITKVANVSGEDKWCNAASVVDINSDGLPDIYVSSSIKKNAGQRRNLLYINQGLNQDSLPVFKEMAADYGLADSSYSVHAAFFDYDNDGDLDVYLLNTKLAKREAARFGDNKVDTTNIDVDKLLRNDWNDSLKHPVFSDVSRQAGIVETGFGLGIAIADINKDGWKDIYVTNDFYGSDLLYINNKNGTFTNKVKEYFKHTSQNAMGNDIADINNDGLADVVAVDMNPEDNFRKKKNMGGNNYFVYQNMIAENFMLQYVRNTFQLNFGPRVNEQDSTGDPVFGDISFYSGVAETDWSWTPSIADFDNDGYRDLLITNGYPRDVTDHDFGAFRSGASGNSSKAQLLEQIPQIKIPNYAFRNPGDLKFENVTTKWGLDEPCFSTGAIYADLDNDGDLDYVINNINEEAFLYENSTNIPGKIGGNYLSIKFKGSKANPDGLGTWAEIYYKKGQMQLYENSPYRGYLSTVDNKAFFGLGKITTIDSVVIRWPGNKKQVMQDVPVNQLMIANINNAGIPDNWVPAPVIRNSLFTDITSAAGVNYKHREDDYIDFNTARLLPHKLSQYGPGLAAADINGDGLDDIVIGGGGDYPGKYFLQTVAGKFILKDMPVITGKDVRAPENQGLLLFDADNDGDVDLYCANGSNEFLVNTKNYQDRLYVNDGKGNFLLDTAAIPINYTSKSCIKAADFDNDGDLDLFVGGRSLPGSYPLPVSSFIYRNDSKKGYIHFTDITNQVAKDLVNIGMVCDAAWTDFDDDGTTDLIIAGEWMPVTFLKNNNGKFENVTKTTGIATETGWWNSITAGDFDNDGDTDYILGNLGTNSFYRASHQYPVSIYANDFDRNGSIDAIPTVFMKDEKAVLKEFTAQNRDDIVEQLPGLKKKFLTYKSFGAAEYKDLFTEDQMKGTLILRANNLKSSYVKNNGRGKFELQDLPAIAQMAPLYGMITDDFNQDGNLDIAISGNDFGTEVVTGRYDALNGLVMLGDGKGNFAPQSLAQSGLFIPGDGKALIRLRSGNKGYLLAASQNRGPLKIFSGKMTWQKIIPLQSGDKSVLITLANGQIRKDELYYGNSFLSQSSRFIGINRSMVKVEVVNSRNEKRILK